MVVNAATSQVNAIHSQACGCKDAADMQLAIRRKLAWDMFEIKIEIIPQQTGSPMKT